MAPGATLSRRVATALAASTTVAVAIGADFAAGEHPLHTATLGVVALVVAALRLRFAGHHGGLFAAVSAALIAQPALHAAMALLPAGAERPSTGAAHTAAEASVTVLHVLVAALVVSAVAGAEKLFLLVAAVTPCRRWLGLLAWSPPRPRPTAPPAPPPAAPVRRWSAVAHMPRRGPPAAARATVV